MSTTPFVSVKATFRSHVANEEVRGWTEQKWNFNMKGNGRPYQVMMAMAEQYLMECSYFLTDEQIQQEIDYFKDSAATLAMHDEPPTTASRAPTTGHDEKGVADGG